MLLTGCSGSAPAAAPPADTSTACRTSISEAAALWDPLHDGTGGYGNTPSLTAPPSLYLTAWSLQLAAYTRIATPEVDIAGVVRWLTTGASNPATFAQETELSPLARVQLAVATLKAIGAPEPAAAEDAVEKLRSGTLYRESAAAKPSWPATALAIRSLTDIGAEVPWPVIRNARASASQLTPTMGLKDIGEDGLPVLITLVMGQPAAMNLAQAPNLSKLLSAWSNTVQKAGPSAITVGDLYDIHQVAQRAGVHMPRVPASFFDALRTSDGYYGLGRTTKGDPQVTYDAITLGAPLQQRADATLRLGQVRNGWLASESPPTAADTYQAAVIDALCAAPTRHQINPQLLAEWITSATAPAAQRSAAHTDSSSALAEACWLARNDQIPLPASALKAERQALTGQLRTDARLPAAGRDLAATDACGVTVPPDLLALLPHTLSTVSPVTMADAFDLYLAGTVLKDTQLIDIARTVATSLRTPASAYRYSGQTQTPDIVSTAEGFVICSSPPPAVRARTLAQFTTPSGPALTVPPAGPGSSTLTVNMASLTAAVILDTGVDDPQYLL